MKTRALIQILLLFADCFFLLVEAYASAQQKVPGFILGLGKVLLVFFYHQLLSSGHGELIELRVVVSQSLDLYSIDGNRLAPI